MPSKRKFYRTVFKVEVLSEEPVPNSMDINDVVAEGMDGDYSIQQSREDQEEVDGPMMAELLQQQGSDPGFFMLTEDGEDEED